MQTKAVVEILFCNGTMSEITNQVGTTTGNTNELSTDDTMNSPMNVIVTYLIVLLFACISWDFDY